jgi:hypothetical protein
MKKKLSAYHEIMDKLPIPASYVTSYNRPVSIEYIILQMDRLYFCFMKGQSLDRYTVLLKNRIANRITTLSVEKGKVDIRYDDSLKGTGRGFYIKTPSPKVLLDILSRYKISLEDKETISRQLGNKPSGLGLSTGPLTRMQLDQNTFDMSRSPVIRAMKERSTRFNDAEKEFLESIDKIGIICLHPFQKITVV